MTPGRPQPVLAVIANWYVLAFGLGALLALIVRATHWSPQLALSFLITFLLLAAAILYQALFASRLSWISPGERMCGREVLDGGKTWCNPYGTNRWALFIVLFLPLALVGNHWDGVFEGAVYPLHRIAIQALLGYLVIASVIVIGSGDPRPSWMLLLYYILQALGSFAGRDPSDSVVSGIAQVLSVLLFALGLMTMIVIRLYDRRRLRRGASSS
ncbi:MAG: hypothetical protein KAY32_14090 [Candidatus Eisenbacteria sp.]|nr:hypothetical protein [Candidatus Eisenbacteria bacterium]